MVWMTVPNTVLGCDNKEPISLLVDRLLLREYCYSNSTRQSDTNLNSLLLLLPMCSATRVCILFGKVSPCLTMVFRAIKQQQRVKQQLW